MSYVAENNSYAFAENITITLKKLKETRKILFFEKF